jgi:hypothetical protein
LPRTRALLNEIIFINGHATLDGSNFVLYLFRHEQNVENQHFTSKRRIQRCNGRFPHTLTALAVTRFPVTPAPMRVVGMRLMHDQQCPVL